MTELTDLSLSEAGDLLGAGEISAVELVEANLRTIEKTEPIVQAYASVLADEALDAARAADAEIAAGGRRGPLHGLPIGIKDNIYTKGIVTESGSRVMTGFVPDYDATCVEKLERAGAIIIGKVHCHEFALGSNEPPTRSPWNLEAYPGGSSIGSGAAVTSRSSFGALGTDTGGSIRVPSSINNLVGMKASFGRVSIYGVVPVAWTLDHVGPMTRRVKDNALLLGGMAGHDPKDPTSADQPVPDFCADLEAGVAGLRIGVERDYFFYDGVIDEIREAVEAVIAEYREMGAEIVEISMPELAITQDALFTIVLSECSTYHRKLIRQHSDKYDPATRAIVQLGELVPATHYLAAQQARTLYRSAINGAFREGRLDAMLWPTMPIPTAPLDQLYAPRADGYPDSPVGSMCHHTFNANLAGLPALSVPCGITSAGLPFGFQLTGRAFDEAMLYRIAYAYEREHDWHLRKAAVIEGLA
ncbi:MAG: amidase [Chloroflexi bacterium]|nr:amidase [Chloroflexota bacterium]